LEGKAKKYDTTGRIISSFLYHKNSILRILIQKDMSSSKPKKVPIF